MSYEDDKLAGMYRKINTHVGAIAFAVPLYILNVFILPLITGDEITLRGVFISLPLCIAGGYLFIITVKYILGWKRKREGEK